MELDCSQKEVCKFVLAIVTQRKLRELQEIANIVCITEDAWHSVRTQNGALDAACSLAGFIPKMPPHPQVIKNLERA